MKWKLALVCIASYPRSGNLRWAEMFLIPEAEDHFWVELLFILEEILHVWLDWFL
jgi:hypothetical protein